MAPNSDKPNNNPLGMIVNNSKIIVNSNTNRNGMNSSVNVKNGIQLITEQIQADFRAFLLEMKALIEKEKRKRKRYEMRRRFLLHRPRLKRYEKQFLIVFNQFFDSIEELVNSYL